ncbi:MAG: hypothetical protein V2A54_15430 [Bacteroidota bacterium]
MKKRSCTRKNYPVFIGFTVAVFVFMLQGCFIFRKKDKCNCGTFGQATIRIEKNASVKPG